MSKRREELSHLKRAIDPIALQTILLDELCGRMEELSEKFDKLGAFITFMGPMTKMFKEELQYQYLTIAAGQHGTVFKLENPRPEVWVGIITQVANDWYPHTVLEWWIDHTPKTVEYSIAEITNPKEFERGIPFHEQVEWIAYNNDVSDHVFGVLCDGFFVEKDKYNKIVGE